MSGRQAVTIFAWKEKPYVIFNQRVFLVTPLENSTESISSAVSNGSDTRQNTLSASTDFSNRIDPAGT